jgi:hypothetical protein
LTWLAGSAGVKSKVQQEWNHCPEISRDASGGEICDPTTKRDLGFCNMVLAVGTAPATMNLDNAEEVPSFRAYAY